MMARVNSTLAARNIMLWRRAVGASANQPATGSLFPCDGRLLADKNAPHWRGASYATFAAASARALADSVSSASSALNRSISGCTRASVSVQDFS